METVADGAEGCKLKGNANWISSNSLEISLKEKWKLMENAFYWQLKKQIRRRTHHDDDDVNFSISFFKEWTCCYFDIFFCWNFLWLLEAKPNTFEYRFGKSWNTRIITFEDGNTNNRRIQGERKILCEEQERRQKSRFSHFHCLHKERIFQHLITFRGLSLIPFPRDFLLKQIKNSFEKFFFLFHCLSC